MSKGEGTLTASLRQVVNQVMRLLEEEQPGPLLRDGGPLSAALAAWRDSLRALAAQPEVRELRDLEQGKLELAGRFAVLQKECADLRARNAELLEQIVQLNLRQQGVRKEQLEQQLQRDAALAEAKRLDLERRDLVRRVAALEERATADSPPAPAAEATVAKRRRRRPAAPERGETRAKRAARPAGKPAPRRKGKRNGPAARRRER